MIRIARHWLGLSLVATATIMTGCADQLPLGPEAGQTPSAGRAGTVAAAVTPDLGSCGNLQVEAGNELVMRVYAKGVQIYHWNGTSWAFDGPEAVLSADAAGTSIVGTHYSGPTWKSLSGSEVKGTILQRCTPNPADIQWLLLGAVSSKGPGVFKGVTFIQRLNTAGGIAPSRAGTLGEEARVPYTTEYLFYRPE